MNCYLIPKGWKVLTWFRNVHMDPEVYLDPRKFDPSRWDKGFIPKAGAFLLVLEAIYAKKYDLPGSRKVDFDRFILLSKWKRMVLSVVSQYRDDFNFGYDRKLKKSSQVSMLVLELKKETVSNNGLAVLRCFYAILALELVPFWISPYVENILTILVKRSNTKCQLMCLPASYQTD
ncbi:unnamed protein product [Brassica oleracea var. botrytis]|uniref:Uncharacterized protein n=1 Tax=Brassica oleracea var. oleracea TaxID=109376 RepID=A0A0D3AVD3_BRAOL